MAGDKNWAIEIYDTSGSGPRLAVKDLIDIAGSVTTAGSRLLGSTQSPALQSAPIVESAVRAGAQVVGKANMTELAFGAQGINPWYGTPVNPLSGELIPGGSSSGSAVAVGWGFAEVGYGTDTGGSVRIPASCCGVLGLKTTFGRVSTVGVYPLSQSLDTVGPLASTPEDLLMGFEWLVGASNTAPTVFGAFQRVVTSESKLIELSIDTALTEAGFDFSESVDPGLQAAWNIGGVIMGVEARKNNALSVVEHHRIDPAIWSRFKLSASRTEFDLQRARDDAADFGSRISKQIEQRGPLVLATIPFEIPKLADAYSRWLNVNTLPFNVSGHPAISFPLPSGYVDRVAKEHGLFDDRGQGVSSSLSRLPVSVQIVGPMGSDESLIATAEAILNRIGG